MAEAKKTTFELWTNRKHSGATPDTLGNVSIAALEDKQIKTAVEKFDWGKTVTIADITKARKWVAKNQSDGKNFQAQCVDADGFLILTRSKRRASA